MAKGAPDAPQQSQDNSLDFLWIVGGILVAILLLWYFENVYIVKFIFKIRLYEITAIEFVANILTKLAVRMDLPVPQLKSLLTSKTFITAHYGSAASFVDVMNVSGAIGNYLKYPIMFILLVLATLLYFGSSASRYRSILDSKRLKALEHENWPQITPVIKLDLLKEDINKGSWAMSLSPMQFCKKHKLLEIETRGGKQTVTLRRGAAYQVLSLQLGPRWRGPDALPDYLKALFAICAARFNGDKTSADALMDRISASAIKEGGELDFSGARELLLKHIYAKKVQKITNLHGYVTTALASLLSASREAGVLASSEFIWLKTVDRRMWYMLNSVGRYTAVTEIAGAFAHWLAERKLGIPLLVPMVDEAVRGLEIALSEMEYKPEDEE